MRPSLLIKIMTIMTFDISTDVNLHKYICHSSNNSQVCDSFQNCCFQRIRSVATKLSNRRQAQPLIWSLEDYDGKGQHCNPGLRNLLDWCHLALSTIPPSQRCHRLPAKYNNITTSTTNMADINFCGKKNKVRCMQ